ncbi:MAG: DUF3179 domain-containing (seleno)protein [Phycisphaerales bacterium]
MPESRSSAAPQRGTSPGHILLIVAAAGLFFFAAGRLIRPLFFDPQSERTASPAGTARFDLTDLQVERLRIESGGVAKDAIVALDETVTNLATGIEHLASDDRIVLVTAGDDRVGYPIRMLRVHEIINDRIGGVDLSVVYCPLCDSVSVIERQDGPAVLAGGFGVSGQLFESNILMYDRTSDGLWSQVQGKAMSGPHAGERLRHLTGWSIERFGAIVDRLPDTRIAVHADDAMKDVYELDPYRGYFANDSLIFNVSHRDPRLPIKARVLGVVDGDVPRAFELGTIARLGVATDGVEPTPGRLDLTLSGGRLTAEVDLDADGVPSRVTVIDAPADAVVVHSFWFAWAGSHPKTDLVADPSLLATVVPPPLAGPPGPS